jgi:hypothetical protein
LDFEKYLKRYVWDHDKTPYFIRVANLNRRQAEYEILAYALLVGFLFALLSIFSLSSHAPMGRSVGASLYSLTIVMGCVLLGSTRHYYAAIYCALAPLAIVIFLAVNGFPPKLAFIDQVVIGTVLLGWGAYALRFLAVVKRYPYMPDATQPMTPGRRQGPAASHCLRHCDWLPDHREHSAGCALVGLLADVHLGYSVTGPLSHRKSSNGH